MREKLIWKEMLATLKLAWLMIGSQLAQLSMVFVDNILVGHLGSMPLAGMALASTLVHFVFIFSIGVITALSPLISNAYGAKQFEAIPRHLYDSLLVSFVLSVFIIVSFYYAGPILRLFGQDEVLIPYVRDYLDLLAWSMPAQLFYIAFRQFTEATLNPRPALIITIAASILNALIGYIFIFGHWGQPALGIRGAALATTVASWLMLISLLIYIGCAHRYRAYHLFNSSWNPSWRRLKHFLGLGLPMGGMWICEVSFFSGMTLVMGHFGSLNVAAHQIAINAASFIFMIPLGLSIALTVRVGQAVGENDWHKVVRIARSGRLLVILMQLFPAALFLLTPEPLTRLYTQELELIRAASALLMVAGIFQIFDGLQVVGAGILRGLKDTRVPFLSTIAAYCVVGFGSTYLLAFHWKLGPVGLWYSMVVGLAAAAFLHYWRFWIVIRTKLDCE